MREGAGRAQQLQRTRDLWQRPFNRAQTAAYVRSDLSAATPAPLSSLSSSSRLLTCDISTTPQHL